MSTDLGQFVSMFQNMCFRVIFVMDSGPYYHFVLYS